MHASLYLYVLIYFIIFIRWHKTIIQVLVIPFIQVVTKSVAYIHINSLKQQYIVNIQKILHLNVDGIDVLN